MLDKSLSIIWQLIGCSHCLRVINSVLESATKEDRDSNGLFPNRWVLFRQPTQQNFSEPTNPPVSAFETGFLDASADTLERFVEATVGYGRLGAGSEQDAFD